MPCRSDHMEPTHMEQYCQQTAQLYLYAMEKLFSLGARTWAPELIKQVTETAKHQYASNNYTAHLCALIGSFTTTEQDLVLYNARDPMSRKLADWWEEHQAVDAKRIRATKTNIGQLVYEVTKLADDLPPALRDKVIGLTNEMHNVLSQQD